MMRSNLSPDPGPDLLGLDNVRLDLPLAGAPSRVLAAFIDHFFLFILQIVSVFGALALFSLLDSDGAWLIGSLILLFFLLQWGYFACFEIALAGRTPGKMMVGLRTVSALGGRPSAAAFLIRNFLRNFDLLIGLPLMLIDRRSRRLGDLVGGTLVVHHRSSAADEEASFHHPDDWNAREVALVEAFLRRAEYLEPDRAQELAQELLSWVGRRSPDFRAESVSSTDGSELEASEGLRPAPEAVWRLRRMFRAEA